METAENNDISKDKTIDIKYSQLQCVFMINQRFRNGNLRYIKSDIDIEHIIYFVIYLFVGNKQHLGVEKEIKTKLHESLST